MTITIYGIKSCSTMKKAFTKLDELGVDYEFHDYKKQGIDKATVEHWVDVLSIDKVLNKRGTAWRKLTDKQKQSAMENEDSAIELLVENTSMIKRPIVVVTDTNANANADNLEQDSTQSSEKILCGYQQEAFDDVFTV